MNMLTLTSIQPSASVDAEIPPFGFCTLKMNIKTPSFSEFQNFFRPTLPVQSYSQFIVKIDLQILIIRMYTGYTCCVFLKIEENNSTTKIHVNWRVRSRRQSSNWFFITLWMSFFYRISSLISGCQGDYPSLLHKEDIDGRFAVAQEFGNRSTERPLANLCRTSWSTIADWAANLIN